MSILYIKRRAREPGPLKTLVVSVIVFIAVMFTGMAMISLAGGVSPVDLFSTVFTIDTLLSPNIIRYTVVTALLALGLMINVSGGYTNLGGEGQVALGMLGLLLASVYGLGLIEGLLISLLLVVVWSSVPYIVKLYLQGSDVLTSFIMNFIALFMMNHIVSYVFRGDIARPRSPPIDERITLHYISPDTGYLGLFSRVSIESMVSLFIATLVFYLLLMRSRIGYSMRLIGYSIKTSTLSGVRIPLYVSINIVLSSLMITLASSELLLGGDRRIYYNDYAKIGIGSMSFGLGYTALGIALLSNNRSYAVILYSYLLSIGYVIVFSTYGYLRLIAGVAIVGLSLLSALLSDLILRYEVRVSWSRRQ